ncbi:hypothetical protein [Rhodanobacter aciditrophus]|uniref:hypothetical protein n=1 Tax=Rhodanobacter aciditrophus TaxID=1623218 RepID=UPI003CF9D0AC
MMRYAAIAVSLFVAVINVHLAATRPVHPLVTMRRGIGIPWLEQLILLAIPNILIFVSANEDLQVSTRFQLAAAGWIWLLVQAGLALYVLYHP